MSAARTASSMDAAAVPAISSASARTRSGSRPAIRNRGLRNAALIASTWARACTPVPTTATTWLSGLASARLADADPAAVRIAVINVPSITATGVPLSGSKQQMIS